MLREVEPLARLARVVCLACRSPSVRPSLATRPSVPHCRVENYYIYLHRPPIDISSVYFLPPHIGGGSCRDAHDCCSSRVCFCCRYIGITTTYIIYRQVPSDTFVEGFYGITAATAAVACCPARFSAAITTPLCAQ